MSTGNTEGKGSPGGRFRPPPANLWNSMIDAGRAFATSQLDQPGQQRIRARETDLIKIVNKSGAARRRGEILKIKDTDRPLTELVDEYIWLKGIEPTASCPFGILKDPAAIDGVEQLQVAGCCLALIDITDATHTRADSIAASYVLQSSTMGPIEILYAPDGTGEKECVVRFSGGGGTETAWATITASGHDAEIQTVDVYRSAKPTTFPTFDCGDATFIDFAYTLSDLIGTRDVLVPAGYRAGTACLLKFSDSDPGTGTGGGAAQAWDGWVVVAANLERCTITTDHDPECCPIEGLKMTRFEDYWIVGGHIGTRNDPCEAP